MADSMITKQALAASIKELMEREPLSKISVGDITSNCGVNRQTFYYHFKDKYELVNWIYYTETVKLMSSFSDRAHWTDGLGALCRYMRDNKRFYINALSTPGQNSFQEYLLEFARGLVRSRRSCSEKARSARRTSNSSPISTRSRSWGSS